jgi:hypothetical protein
MQDGQKLMSWLVGSLGYVQHRVSRTYDRCLPLPPPLVDLSPLRSDDDRLAAIRWWGVGRAILRTSAATGRTSSRNEHRRDTGIAGHDRHAAGFIRNWSE